MLNLPYQFWRRISLGFAAKGPICAEGLYTGMIYREFPVHQGLTAHVQLLWMMESEPGDAFIPREQIMPDGIVEIIFHYADPWITTIAGGSPRTQPNGFAICQMRKFIQIEPSGRTGFISVRFFPWGAYHFFARPIRDFLDDMVGIEALWPEHAAAILGDVRTAGSPEARSDLLQRFLLDRLAEDRRDDPALDAAVRLIRQSKGFLPIDEVLRRTGLSRKRLESGFVGLVGTTPKIFSRITRFLNVCLHIEEQRCKSLTQLAYDCGYFDQAHFIKEFREFAGFTPKEFFARSAIGITDL